MKNKFTKYVKFIFLVLIILSIIAPSYAALSANDGSVFMTKSEFDSAMIDFDSRLTTFEAGINSKIDSQVTSYLDKNGIWSGKSQGTYKSDEMTMSTIEGKIYNYYVALTGDNKNPALNFFTGDLYTATKSGLAYTTINWNADWALLYTAGENHKLSQGSFHDNSVIYYDDSFDKVATKVKTFELWGSEANKWSIYHVVSGLTVTRPFTYFVTKGVKYSIRSSIQFIGRFVLGTNNAIQHAVNYGSHYNYARYATEPKNDVVNKAWLTFETIIY